MGVAFLMFTGMLFHFRFRSESFKIFRLRKMGAEGEVKCSKAMALLSFAVTKLAL